MQNETQKSVTSLSDIADAGYLIASLTYAVEAIADKQINELDLEHLPAIRQLGQIIHDKAIGIVDAAEGLAMRSSKPQL